MDRTVSSLPKGTALGRYVQALINSRGDYQSAAQMAERWRDSPHVGMTLRAYTAPMTTTGAGASLMSYGVGQEFIELIRGKSVIGALESKMRRAPFRTKVPRETTGASGGWIAETNAIPATALALDTLTVDVYKSAMIIILSQELTRMSTPSAVAATQNSLVKGVAAYLDGQFLDPAITLISGERPASVTNGGGTVTTTGATVAAIEADLQSMLALLGSWDSPVWILRPKTAAYLSTKFAAVGQGPNIMGFPFVASANSPAQIALVNAGDILYADENGIDLSYAESASLIVDDNPQASPMTSSLQSMFQRDLAAIRCIREISWLKAHASSSVVMAVSY
jgi:HK97 family phage major capsid protein